ncbi:methionyl-tRNA formyltransferase [Bdellovibrio sp. 22V]|uniref:methionyl-tRNA formyltransferase n=1 Tax=Bdellovibrio sp. 22V TaxID=3044166 RepID=UPI002542C182|nr:methionyl-tRNA formyltransferase [Bdellovibrio sp. 22V]WII71829.1 methionyl-tRNA formyltransferase [Bdellovibrio sp. 22V]
MKIGYFADGPWAHKALELIFASSAFEVKFICVRFDARDPVLIEMGEKNSIPVLMHPKINSEEFRSNLVSYECDIFVSMSFNQIFKKQILNIPPLGVINCHAGKLPFYRGRNILNWALINDEKEFGITVHFVDEGIDTGDIILQETYPISDEDDYGSLLRIAQNECAFLLFKALKVISEGSYERIVQASIHPEGFYCVRRLPGDEFINWHQSSRDIFNFIRAVSAPGPMAHTRHCEDIVKISKAFQRKEVLSFKGIPGSVIGKTEKGYIVKTVDSSIEIHLAEEQKILKIGDRLS